MGTKAVEVVTRKEMEGRSSMVVEAGEGEEEFEEMMGLEEEMEGGDEGMVQGLGNQSVIAIGTEVEPGRKANGKVCS